MKLSPSSAAFILLGSAVAAPVALDLAGPVGSVTNALTGQLGNLGGKDPAAAAGGAKGALGSSQDPREDSTEDLAVNSQNEVADADADFEASQFKARQLDGVLGPVKGVTGGLPGGDALGGLTGGLPAAGALGGAGALPIKSRGEIVDADVDARTKNLKLNTRQTADAHIDSLSPDEVKKTIEAINDISNTLQVDKAVDGKLPEVKGMDKATQQKLLSALKILVKTLGPYTKNGLKHLTPKLNGVEVEKLTARQVPGVGNLGGVLGAVNQIANPNTIGLGNLASRQVPGLGGLGGVLGAANGLGSATNGVDIDKLAARQLPGADLGAEGVPAGLGNVVDDVTEAATGAVGGGLTGRQVPNVDNVVGDLASNVVNGATSNVLGAVGGS
ncbi:hypothetical protein AJ79_03394 [Helicocarpus griseus UAMH5409]|uniref:Uncharacterized protein n=1 Tax=Helicocarpus griseus UAMH5409 TaxID=1447875 RepID=A0A2B7XX85_9EURO|nr:hypothetical protein AJ79_03394 [Helicocarpus griseus UAMH5409]